MTAIARRSMKSLVSRKFVLATADDLDGTIDNTQAFDVSGAAAVIVEQLNNGTNGTAGIDCIEVSHDGGKQWAPDDTAMLIDANAVSGTILVNGVMNVAGTEPTLSQLFKCGPWDGPTAIRIGRLTTTTGGTTWVTGAPTVNAYAIGLAAAVGTAGQPAPSALV